MSTHYEVAGLKEVAYKAGHKDALSGNINENIPQCAEEYILYLFTMFTYAQVRNYQSSFSDLKAAYMAGAMSII